MMRELVSVVMPSYNQAAFIGEAIQSVLRQTYQNLELIIVDNYSTDATAAVVSGFDDSRVRFYSFSNEGTIAASRNVGIRHARGELVAFIDSDDLWADEKLSVQVPCFDNPDVALVSTDVWLMADGRRAYRAFLGHSARGFVDCTYEDLIQRDPIVTSSVMTRKRVLTAVDGFDEDPELRCTEDFDLWLRIARLGTVRVLGTPLAYYRVAAHDARNKAEETRRGLLVIEKHSRAGYLRDPIVHACATTLVYLGVASMARESDPLASRDYYRRALRLAPHRYHQIRAAFGYATTWLKYPALRRLLALLHRLRALVLLGRGLIWRLATRLGSGDH